MSIHELEIVAEIERIRPDRSGRPLDRSQMSQKNVNRLDHCEPLVHHCPRLRTAVGRQNLLNPQRRLLRSQPARKVPKATLTITTDIDVVCGSGSRRQVNKQRLRV
jgi:hypothetical protein